MIVINGFKHIPIKNNCRNNKTFELLVKSSLKKREKERSPAYTFNQPISTS